MFAAGTFIANSSITSYQYIIKIVGSARPEVRGTAEPHGGAYPP